MMNIYKLAFAILLFGSVTLSSCDNIADDDRFIPIEKPETPIEDVTKILLIQEFTGNNCTNCPNGAATLHSVQEAYPGQTIVVGLHPYGKNGSDPNTQPILYQDFRTEAAQAMYEIYQPSGFPCAVFNGSLQSTDHISWFSDASKLIGQIANMSITAECGYDEESRSLSVDYAIEFTHDISDAKGFGVMVWIMENDIVGFQLDNGKLIADYVHNHVLRASLNGNNGEIIGSSFKARDNYTGNASISLPENWNAENCQVVVYVFKASTYETEQAAIADVCQ